MGKNIDLIGNGAEGPGRFTGYKTAVFQAPKPTEEPGRAGKETTTHVQFAPGRTEYPLEDFGFQRRPGEDPKNMAAAELFVQDALEYLNQQEVDGFLKEKTKRLRLDQLAVL